jgi:uncharacterized protein (TIGR02284 family)
MENEKTIDLLNSLITIHNDRIEGYETALNETEEQDLKTLFASFIDNSQKCKQELAMELNRLGGEVAEGTLASGKFFRAWMDVKAALTGRDREAILDSCEYGEDHTLDAYDEALEDDVAYLSTNQQTMLAAQRSLLETDYDQLQVLRDALADA